MSIPSRKDPAGRELVTILLLGLVLATFLPGRVASAHNRDLFYTRWWQSDLNVDWHFHSDFPVGTGARDRVKNGAGQWNAVNATMNFDFVAGDISSVDYLDCPSTAQRDVIHWLVIDGSGGILAQTRSCVFSGNADRMKTFQMRLDKQESWYVGTGIPGGSAIHMWAVATHEFGHATGFGLGGAVDHFSDNATECVADPYHTMCPFYRYVQFDLEPHDIHTFANRY